MTDFLATVLGAMIVVAIMIIAPVIGGVIGWAFSWVFDDSFKQLQLLISTNATGFELGAIFGFIGLFFTAASK